MATICNHLVACQAVKNVDVFALKTSEAVLLLFDRSQGGDACHFGDHCGLMRGAS
jgi:hypothetical protein